MRNPYTPTHDVAAPKRKKQGVFVWNSIIALAMLWFAALPARFLFSYYGSVVGRENADADTWSVFACQVANTLSVAVGVLLVLASFSTFPFHHRPLLTRGIAIATCVLMSLDFHLLRYRVIPEHPVQAMVFAALMPTLILFGCGVPHAAVTAFKMFRNRSSERTSDQTI